MNNNYYNVILCDENNENSLCTQAFTSITLSPKITVIIHCNQRAFLQDQKVYNVEATTQVDRVKCVCVYVTCVPCVIEASHNPLIKTESTRGGNQTIISQKQLGEKFASPN